MVTVLSDAVISSTAVAFLFGISFLIAFLGQMSGYRPMLIAGISLLFVSTILMLVGGLTQYLSQNEPVVDPFRTPSGAPSGTDGKETIRDLRQKQQGAR